MGRRNTCISLKSLLGTLHVQLKISLNKLLAFIKSGKGPLAGHRILVINLKIALMTNL